MFYKKELKLQILPYKNWDFLKPKNFTEKMLGKK